MTKCAFGIDIDCDTDKQFPKYSSHPTTWSHSTNYVTVKPQTPAPDKIGFGCIPSSRHPPGFENRQVMG